MSSQGAPGKFRAGNIEQAELQARIRQRAFRRRGRCKRTRVEVERIQRGLLRERAAARSFEGENLRARRHAPESQQQNRNTHRILRKS
jgi:hypothetical protein